MSFGYVGFFFGNGLCTLGFAASDKSASILVAENLAFPSISSGDTASLSTEAYFSPA